MEELYLTIKQLQLVTGRKDKENILESIKESQFIKNVFEFVYNPYIVTGLSTKKMNKSIKHNCDKGFDNLTDIMTYLKAHNTGTDMDIKIIQNSINLFEEKYQDLVKKIVTKSLKVGCTAKTFNKIYGSDFIPQFEVMLAESFFKQKENYLDEKSFIITTKLDGMRCVIIKEDDNVVFFSRQGQPITGLNDIVKDMEKFPNNIVLDGELVAENTTNLTSADLYRKTMRIARKDGVKKGLIFNCFDYIPLEDFKKGICHSPCSNRKATVNSLITLYSPRNIVEVKPLYVGNDQAEIYKWLEWAKDRDLEGVMINIDDSPYESKRTKNLLKVKVMQTCDLRIIDYIEGEGRNAGRLGAFVVDYKGNSLKVGGGYTDKQREEYWRRKDELIGRVITVQYFEETNNLNDGVGLRFPVFKEVREIGKEVSYD